MSRIFTIGHSTIGLKPFIQKLQEFSIDILIDVRTKPFSSRVKWFNRDVLIIALPRHGIKYEFRGNNLGGLGENVNFYETIHEVITLSENVNVVLMCSEGDFHKCHRYTKLTPEFELKGVKVEHILWENLKHVQQKLFTL